MRVSNLGHTLNIIKVSSRSLSLTNPMFVYNKKIPEIPPEEQAPAGDKDFLSMHGGKIALFGFSAAAALIYRWLQGGKNKKKVEENIVRESPLHPYESNDLRLKNSMTVDQFKSFADACLSQFPSGAASYKDFLSFFHKSTSYRIVDAYVLDRLVLHYVETNMAIHASIDSDVKLPISLLLVVLSNVVTGDPRDRAEMFFSTCRNTAVDEDSNTSHTSLDGEEKELYCSLKQAEVIIDALDKGWQV